MIHEPDALRFFRAKSFHPSDTVRAPRLCRKAAPAAAIPPYPGIIPSFTSGCPSFAVLLAIRIEHAQRQLASAAQRKSIDRANRRLAQSSPADETRPAQTAKTLCHSPASAAPVHRCPLPRQTTFLPRRSKSARAPRHPRAHPINASRNSSIVLRFSAFNTFGRLNVTNAIPSLFSYNQILVSHLLSSVSSVLSA